MDSTEKKVLADKDLLSDLNNADKDEPFEMIYTERDSQQTHESNLLLFSKYDQQQEDVFKYDKPSYIARYMNNPIDEQ